MTSRSLAVLAGRPLLVVALVAASTVPLLAWYDPILDYGSVPGHPEILWLKDHGDLTACCHVQGGVTSRTVNKAGIKTRFDSIMAKRDFLYVFPSAYTVQVLASSGGGAAAYNTICDNDIAGVAHRGIDYRFCTPQDTMQGIVGYRNLDYWLPVDQTTIRYTLLHELGHRWGAQCYTTTPNVHIGFSHWYWGYPQNSYFDVPSLMAEYTTSRTNFDLLDLYLMGLASPAEVPNHDYVDPLGQRTPVTIQSIVDATGVRNPAYPSAPQNFSVAFVVITPDTAAGPNSAELDMVESWRASLPGWWSIATSGRSALSIDIASSAAGAVPDGGSVPGIPLTITENGDGDLVLSWGASCAARDSDYYVYEGTLGSNYSHAARLCSTGGMTTVTLSTDGLSHYYLVVPKSGAVEGSYGVASNGVARPPGVPACAPQAVAPACGP